MEVLRSVEDERTKFGIVAIRSVGLGETIPHDHLTVNANAATQRPAANLAATPTAEHESAVSFEKVVIQPTRLKKFKHHSAIPTGGVEAARIFQTPR